MRKATPLALIVFLWGLTIASAAILVLHGLSVDSPSLRVGVPALPPVHAVPVTGPRPGSHPGASQGPVLALGPGGGTTAIGGTLPPGGGAGQTPGGATAFEPMAGQTTAARRLVCQATVDTPQAQRAFCGPGNAGGEGEAKETAAGEATEHRKHEGHGHHNGTEKNGKHRHRGRGDHHEGDDRESRGNGRHDHDGENGNGGDGHGGEGEHGKHHAEGHHHGHHHGHRHGHGDDGGD